MESPPLVADVPLLLATVVAVGSSLIGRTLGDSSFVTGGTTGVGAVVAIVSTGSDMIDTNLQSCRMEGDQTVLLSLLLLVSEQPRTTRGTSGGFGGETNACGVAPKTTPASEETAKNLSFLQYGYVSYKRYKDPRFDPE